MKHKLYNKFRIWWFIHTDWSSSIWRVYYSNGSRTRLIPYMEAEGLQGKFGGEIKVDKEHVKYLLNIV